MLALQYDVKRHYATHRERVKHMVPAVDNTPPEDFGHFHYNAKRAMLQAERLFEIDRVRNSQSSLHMHSRVLAVETGVPACAVLSSHHIYHEDSCDPAWGCRIHKH